VPGMVDHLPGGPYAGDESAKVVQRL